MRKHLCLWEYERGQVALVRLDWNKPLRAWVMPDSLEKAAIDYWCYFRSQDPWPRCHARLMMAEAISKARKRRAHERRGDDD